MKRKTVQEIGKVIAELYEDGLITQEVAESRLRKIAAAYRSARNMREFAKRNPTKTLPVGLVGDCYKGA